MTLAKAPSEVKTGTKIHHSTQTTTSLGQGDTSMLRMKWSRSKTLMMNQSLKMERKILAISMDNKMFTIRMRLRIGHQLLARVEFIT